MILFQVLNIFFVENVLFAVLLHNEMRCRKNSVDNIQIIICYMQLFQIWLLFLQTLTHITH